MNFTGASSKPPTEVFLKTSSVAMTGWTRQIGAAIVQACDFSSFGSVIDIGGGHGILLTLILRAFPNVRGIVFDTDAAISGAERHIATASLSSRRDALGGNFFAGVPRGGDVYILSQILHDWDDEHAIRIVTNCQRAMSNTAKLLVVEMVIRPGMDSSLAMLADLHMMDVTGGRERTETRVLQSSRFHHLCRFMSWETEELDERPYALFLTAARKSLGSC